MPIRFTCEVTDPHAEAVIGLLGERLNGDTKKMLQVVECAKKWLEMESPIPFDQSLYEQMSSSLVLVTVEGGETSRTVCQTPLDANLARADSFVGADEGLGGTLIDRWNRSPPQRAAWAAMSLKDWIAYLS